MANAPQLSIMLTSISTLLHPLRRVATAATRPRGRNSGNINDLPRPRSGTCCVFCSLVLATKHTASRGARDGVHPGSGIALGACMLERPKGLGEGLLHQIFSQLAILDQGIDHVERGTPEPVHEFVPRVVIAAAGAVEHFEVVEVGEVGARSCVLGTEGEGVGFQAAGGGVCVFSSFAGKRKTSSSSPWS